VAPEIPPAGPARLRHACGSGLRPGCRTRAAAAHDTAQQRIRNSKPRTGTTRPAPTSGIVACSAVLTYQGGGKEISYLIGRCTYLLRSERGTPVARAAALGPPACGSSRAIQAVKGSVCPGIQI